MILLDAIGLITFGFLIGVFVNDKEIVMAAPYIKELCEALEEMLEHAEYACGSCGREAHVRAKALLEKMRADDTIYQVTKL